MKYVNLSILCAVLTLLACNPRGNTQMYEMEIMEADKEFSNFSIRNGQVAAFLEYAAPDVVLIKPNMHPIVGHERLQQHYAGRADSAFVLTWEPQYARVAKSGELGYTYGYWQFYLKSQPDSVEKGTYATVWQRQPDGKWKFVLDLGNEGLGE